MEAPPRYRLKPASFDQKHGSRPWCAQRVLMRHANDPECSTLIAVTGRQVGKSLSGVWITLHRATVDRNGASCVLVPTYRHGLPIAAHLKQWGATIGAEWKEQKAVLELKNGHKVWLRSADDPDATRGLTITGTFWIDEASYVSEAAYVAGLGCLVTARNCLVLVTTTPAGARGWVHKTWTDKADPTIRRVLVRSMMSPIANQSLLKKLSAGMGGEMSAQELDAAFLDARSMPFRPEDIDRLLSEPLPEKRGERLTLGCDLAKERDWTVLTLMNEFGEAWIVGRWRHVAWPDTTKRILQAVSAYDALLCMDVGAGGGYGGALADFLLAGGLTEDRLIRVKTANPGAKAQVVEALEAAVQHGRLRVDNSGPDAKVLRHEMTFFTRSVEVKGGVEYVTYKGPDGVDEHDDTVIALALANWGRERWENPTEGDFGGFFTGTKGGRTTALPEQSSWEFGGMLPGVHYSF